MTVNRLDGVMGAGRVEATPGPQKGADKILVCADQQDHESCHLRLLISSHARSRVCRIRLGGTATAPRLQSTTKSTRGSRAAESRKLSRIRRLIRFRSTARRAQRFDMARPRRGPLVVPERASTMTGASPNRWGFANTRLKATEFRSRRARGRLDPLGVWRCEAPLVSVRGSTERAPLPFALQEPCGRFWWRFWHENRGCERV